jgi:FKBP-type peptidyl-prolyl cis-trans isomerase SlyD
MSDTIKPNKVATVNYTGSYLDGVVFDSSEGKEPLSFLVGKGQMISGFEQELMGAKIGEKREFTLTPDKAYGERDENAIQKMEKGQFPDDMNLEVGMIVGAQSDQGPIQFSIVDIDGEMVTVDFNHQMAGMTLRFNVEVVNVRDATSEEILHGHAHGKGGINH